MVHRVHDGDVATRLRVATVDWRAIVAADGEPEPLAGKMRTTGSPTDSPGTSPRCPPSMAFNAKDTPATGAGQVGPMASGGRRHCAYTSR